MIALNDFDGLFDHINLFLGGSPEFLQYFDRQAFAKSLFQWV